MARMSDIVTTIETRIDAVAKTYHISAQFARFVRLVAFSTVALIPAMSTGHVHWVGVAPLIVGALETAFRQIWPTFSLTSTKMIATKVVDETLQRAGKEATGLAGSIPGVAETRSLLGTTGLTSALPPTTFTGSPTL